MKEGKRGGRKEGDEERRKVGECLWWCEKTDKGNKIHFIGI